MEQPLGTSRRPDRGIRGFAQRGSWSPARLLPIVCLLWLGFRFLPAPSQPPPAVRAFFASIRVGPSARTGRLAVSGLPAPHADPLQLHRYPDWLAATRRLAAQVEHANGDLEALAARISGWVETYPNGAAGFRSPGRVTVFRGSAAQRLRSLGSRGPERPWEILGEIRETLALRLEAPGNFDDLGESAERQAIGRLYREIDEAMLAAERLTAEAAEQFQREVEAIPRSAAGPFRRRGPGRILEILLASLLGALLREAIRGSPGRAPPWTPLLTAPTLATGLILLLEGSRLLPMHPIEGVSLLFVPLALALGYSTGAALDVLGRRVETPSAQQAEPPPEMPPTTRRAERARLPFFPRRR